MAGQSHPYRRLRRTLAATGAAALIGGVIVLPASSAAAETVINLKDFDGPFEVADAYVQFSEFPSSTGTGVFESFVRIQAAPTERGFNSDTPNFDDLQSSNFTRDLPLSAVPVLTAPGDLPGLPAGNYREFRLDINQKSSESLLTLETAKLWISSSQNVAESAFDENTKTLDLSNETLAWDLDGEDADTRILLDYNRAPGSGNGDMVLLVPDPGFSCGTGNDCYVNLYSEFGGYYTGATATERDGSTSNDGFEEWSVRKAITAPTATKTLDLAFDRDITWELTKTVDVDDWNLFDGDSATSEYTVTLDKDVTNSNFRASGVVTLLNGGNDQIKVETVTDTLSPGGAATITDCVVDDVIDGNSPSVGAPPFAGQSGVVEAGETMQCTYTKDLGDSQTIGTQYTNSVTFFEKVSGENVEIASAQAISTLSIDNATVTGAESVDVTDSVEGDLGTFNGDDTETYSTGFTCVDEGDNPNTATAFAAGTDDEVDSDSASVKVTCYTPTVTKDAATSLTRTYDWDVDKKVKQVEPFGTDYTPQYPNYVDDIPSGGGEALTLSDGQILSLQYGVDVTYTSADSDWAVAGSITVTNPNPDRVLTVNSLADVVSPDILAAVTCPAEVDFPHDIAASGTLVCTYSAALPNANSRTNTATATYQNYDFDGAGETESGTSDVSNSPAVAVDFASATVTEVDPCVDVYDDKTTGTDVLLGTVCAPGSGRPAGAEIAGTGPEFEYTLTIGKVADPTTVDIPLECDENSFTNVASVYRPDESAAEEDTELASDDVTVQAYVACDEGCTLTQGYWKTHSLLGPAPYDDTWALLPNGADTPFFDSGKTWYQVFWTAPGQAKKNNFKSQEYVVLAHQYMAAQLNVLNGASMPAEVQTAFDLATGYFEDGGTGATRAQVIGWAGILGSYNEGDYSQHCDQ